MSVMCNLEPKSSKKETEVIEPEVANHVNPETILTIVYNVVSVRLVAK